uniref:Fibrinogen C-terminal domain-containing protein n=1 Tax=Amphimedon queenslandica TaxID=400682 RepID=A0A1X7VN37_AMPQE
MVTSQWLCVVIAAIAMINIAAGNCPDDTPSPSPSTTPLPSSTLSPTPLVVTTEFLSSPNTTVNAPPVCVMPPDCRAWQELGINQSGVYPVKPNGGEAFQVYCDMETDGGGWTVFQRRQDGSVAFNRNWADYEKGFGNLTGEFWLGLSKIHRLTHGETNTLRVDFGGFDGSVGYAKYSEFNIGNETSHYTLTVGGHSGTAGNDLAAYNGHRFATYDNDFDNCIGKWGNNGWWQHGISNKSYRICCSSRRLDEDHRILEYKYGRCSY